MSRASMARTVHDHIEIDRNDDRLVIRERPTLRITVGLTLFSVSVAAVIWAWAIGWESSALQLLAIPCLPIAVAGLMFAAHRVQVTIDLPRGQVLYHSSQEAHFDGSKRRKKALPLDEFSEAITVGERGGRRSTYYRVVLLHTANDVIVSSHLSEESANCIRNEVNSFLGAIRQGGNSQTHSAV